MKKRKSNKAPPRIVHISHGGRTAYVGEINGLPVGEAVLISKSIEFFNDPEPCFIHRSAVRARLYAEFEQWLDGKRLLSVAHSQGPGDNAGAGDSAGPGDSTGPGDPVEAAFINLYNIPEQLRGYFLLGG